MNEAEIPRFFPPSPVLLSFVPLSPLPSPPTTSSIISSPLLLFPSAALFSICLISSSLPSYANTPPFFYLSLFSLSLLPSTFSLFPSFSMSHLLYFALLPIFLPFLFLPFPLSPSLVILFSSPLFPYIFTLLPYLLPLPFPLLSPLSSPHLPFPLFSCFLTHISPSLFPCLPSPIPPSLPPSSPPFPLFLPLAPLHFPSRARLHTGPGAAHTHAASEISVCACTRGACRYNVTQPSMNSHV